MMPRASWSHAAWYPTQEEPVVVDSLRTAIRRYGVPQRLVHG